jgi:ABC-2 type transport system ATP-binding protein
MDAIRTDNLTRRFGDTIAVNGVDLTVAEGELFGLVGSDGAGKTTIMRMLTGIMDPTSGSATVMGRDIVREAEALKEEIGYMSQRFGLYPDLSVLENIHFYADIYGLPGKGRRGRIDSLLSFSGLAAFKKRRAGNLSGGMKQKLGLACALIHTPRVLFLDEPTNGVDPVSRREFWRILYKLLKEGTTIFVATAYLDEADRCHRVGLIHKGNLLACDRPERLRGLMQGTILEVRSDNVRAAALLLREQLPAASVGLFGDRLHLVTDDPAAGEQRVAEILKNGDIALLGFRRIEPSLEDVFVSVLGNSREGVPDEQ